jgi:flagellar basal body-associated protein FliL
MAVLVMPMMAVLAIVMLVVTVFMLALVALFVMLVHCASSQKISNSTAVAGVCADRSPLRPTPPILQTKLQHATTFYYHVNMMMTYF